MVKNSILQLIAIFVICFVCVYGYGNPVSANSCYHKIFSQQGVCVPFELCARAIEDIEFGIYPENCGFEGNVCCTNRDSPTETSTETPTEPPTTTSTTTTSTSTTTTTTTPKPERKPGDIAEQKCWEYSESVYNLTYAPTPLLTREILNMSTCTILKSTFVIGGEDAKDREFPHMALLGYNVPGNSEQAKRDKWRCAGTLISEQFVLTAAHCLHHRTYKNVSYIRLGELNLARDDDLADPQDFNVIEIIKHPGYKRPSRYNDIALLKMDRPVKFNEFIRPACLHLTTDIPKNRYIATGWGLTETETEQHADHLQKVILNSYSQTECNRSYENMYDTIYLRNGITETQICAGGDKDERKDTCQGDSGGPLQILHPKVHCMYSIVGVTSFGKQTCAIPGVPGVYARVSNYIDWIEKTVWP